MKLPDVAFTPVEPSLIPPDLKKIERPQRRILELILKGSSLSQAQLQKRWSLDFLLSPHAFNGGLSAPEKLSSLTFERTSLLPNLFDLSARAVSTQERIELPAQIAFRSIGYKSTALPGLSSIDVPFDDSKGIIPNDLQGRVVKPAEGPAGTSIHVPGMYCAGWVKRGPTGVIASTMNDAFGTAEAIANDWHGHVKFIDGGNDGPKMGWEALKNEVGGIVRRVSWADWKKIDKAERKNGQRKGKERQKFTSIKDMLAVLD